MAQKPIQQTQVGLINADSVNGVTIGNGAGQIATRDGSGNINADSVNGITIGTGPNQIVQRDGTGNIEGTTSANICKLSGDLLLNQASTVELLGALVVVVTTDDWFGGLIPPTEMDAIGILTPVTDGWYIIGMNVYVDRTFTGTPNGDYYIQARTRSLTNPGAFFGASMILNVPFVSSAGVNPQPILAQGTTLAYLKANQQYIMTIYTDIGTTPPLNLVGNPGSSYPNHVQGPDHFDSTHWYAVRV